MLGAMVWAHFWSLEELNLFWAMFRAMIRGDEKVLLNHTPDRFVVL